MTAADATFYVYRSANANYRAALEARDAAALWVAAQPSFSLTPDQCAAFRATVADYEAAYDANEAAYRAWLVAGYPRP